MHFRKIFWIGLVIILAFAAIAALKRSGEIYWHMGETRPLGGPRLDFFVSYIKRWPRGWHVEDAKNELTTHIEWILRQGPLHLDEPFLFTDRFSAIHAIVNTDARMTDLLECAAWDEMARSGRRDVFVRYAGAAKGWRAERARAIAEWSPEAGGPATARALKRLELAVTIARDGKVPAAELPSRISHWTDDITHLIRMRVGDIFETVGVEVSPQSCPQCDAQLRVEGRYHLEEATYYDPVGADRQHRTVLAGAGMHGTILLLDRGGRMLDRRQFDAQHDPPPVADRPRQFASRDRLSIIGPSQLVDDAPRSISTGLYDIVSAAYGPVFWMAEDRAPRIPSSDSIRVKNALPATVRKLLSADKVYEAVHPCVASATNSRKYRWNKQQS